MSEPSSASASSTGPRCRLLLQQCTRAQLRLDDVNWVEIGRGVVVYVSFFQGADEEIARKAAETVVKIKLSESNNGKRIAVLDLPGSVLLIPQACLGGKRKDNSMQYHKLTAKMCGMKLFQAMESELQKLFGNATTVTSISDEESRPVVRSGIYGNRQVLKMESETGPYSHIIDL